ncbi:hypothetical protein LPJ72_000156 [Coemansia sp. Benny D160-2]|nr:hypothetical protein LPJ72_000156 [Coemansia sp. Benny D160-2]
MSAAGVSSKAITMLAAGDGWTCVVAVVIALGQVSANPLPVDPETNFAPHTTPGPNRDWPLNII